MPNREQTTVALLAVALLSVGCSDRPSIVGCADGTVCTLFPGGQCLPAPVGFDVCAYPDTECPSGFSWSPQAGSLAGECIPSDIDAGTDAPTVDANIPTGMRLVPTGAFAMGCDVSIEGTCPNANELPLHNVTVSSFLIDEREVSRADYMACVDAGTCLALAGQSASDLPSAAPWQSASSYCAWIGKRLPSEAEWEYAARGSDRRKYPWGNTAPTCDQAAYVDCGGGYEFVTENPQGASPFGAINMAGNAAEWVKDWYSDTYYSSSPAMDPQGPSTGDYKLVRGGSGADAAASIRTAIRSSKASTGLYGFRCAKNY